MDALKRAEAGLAAPDAGQMKERRMYGYNHHRPNKVLGGFTPEIAAGLGRMTLVLKRTKNGGITSHREADPANRQKLLDA